MMPAAHTGDHITGSAPGTAEEQPAERVDGRSPATVTHATGKPAGTGLPRLPA
ncbi:hypothetical protein AB0903_06340 [Streptomyces sp. NPDC048389]|uniref:hypothetical protein n=1 Tax=Streptomyces sp. NPDC048389 TaxID=3154622 RepID=UPI003453BB99